MSDREKKLLVIMVILGFFVINAVGYKMIYLPKKQAAEQREKRLRGELQQAEDDLRLQDAIQDEMDWVAKYEPEPVAVQKTEADLEQLANREAQRRGLEVKRRKLLPAVTHPNLTYYRARFEMEVSGREQVLYQWLDRLHSPADYRAVTMMRLNPKRDDDTQIDCMIVVEQWGIDPANADPATIATADS